MNRRTISLVSSLLVCLTFPIQIGATRMQAGGSQPISEQTAADLLVSGQSNAQQSICERLIGDWQSEKFGTQTLSANADGTAVLKMNLNTLAAALYGREVTLLLTWKMDGNLLTQQIVGGSPERSVEKLTRKYGATYCYRIVELTGNQLVVEDTSTGKTCRWASLQDVSVQR